MASSATGLPKTLILRESTRAVADDSGAALIASPSPPFFLAARAPGSAPYGVVCESAEAFRSLDLPPEQHLVGRVVSAVEGTLSGVTVLAYRAFQDEYYYDHVCADDLRTAGMFFESRTAPASDGAFDLSGLPASRVYVAAYGPGTASERRADFILPTQEPCELVLRTTLTLEGHVLEEGTGQPIEGARVSAFLRSGQLGFRDCTVTTTLAGGSFQLLGVPIAHDDLGLSVFREGYAAVTQRIATTELRDQKDLVFLLQRSCRVSGTIRSRNGPPLPNAYIQVHEPATLDMVRYTQADAAGEFVLDFIASGRAYTLVGSAKKHYYLFLKDTDLSARDPLELVLEPQPTLRGHVTTEDYPIRNGTARIIEEDDAGNLMFEANAEIDPDSGDFHFPALAAGQYLLDVVADGLAPAHVPQVPVLDGAEPNVIDVAMTRGAVLRGTVRARDSGQPVPGAEVTFADRSWQGSIWGGLPGAACATTDGTGAFLLEHAPAGSTTVLLVDHEGYAPANAEIKVSPGQPSARLDVLLDRACCVTATIRNEEDRRFLALDGYVHTADRRIHSAMTTSGELRFDRLPPGEVTVQAIIAAGVRDDIDGCSFHKYLRLRPGETQTVAFTLAGGARISGRVTGPALSDSFRRLAVSAASADDPVRFDLYTVTDHFYRYVLVGVPPGRHVVTVQTEDFGAGFTVSRTVDVLPGADIQLDFHLPVSGLRGKVTDSGGTPLVGAVIYVRAWDAARDAFDDSPHGQIQQTAVSDECGSYFVTGVSPGAYAFSAKAAGCAWAEGLFEIPDEETVVEQDIILEKDGRLEVLVSDRAGTLVTGATCTVQRDGVHYATPLTALAESLPDRLVFAGAATATYRVRVRADGFFPADETVSCASGTTATLRIALRRPGSLAIDLVGPDGAAATHAPVEVQDLESGAFAGDWIVAGLVTSSTSSSTTDAHGELRLDGLPEGRFRVRALGVAKDVDVLPGALTGPIRLQQIP
ncbi:MAG: carboxypeptidase regulatory-like domain-containing protein [Planctomycetes bacterium]|nr:carboxypeptidase regulatory-like domain-containing protein [Planctomycetota bacterium]